MTNSIEHDEIAHATLKMMVEKMQKSLEYEKNAGNTSEERLKGYQDGIYSVTHVMGELGSSLHFRKRRAEREAREAQS